MQMKTDISSEMKNPNPQLEPSPSNDLAVEIESHAHDANLFGGRFRYFLLLLSWFCLASISSNMLALNFTLICMAPPANGTVFEEDAKDREREKLYVDYSSEEKGQLMWAVAFGSMLGTFPFAWLYTCFGARYVLFGAGLLSAAATALTPLAVTQLGLPFFIGLRFLQGIAYSADFAAMDMICSRWASLKQNALFISVLTCYSPLSTAVTNPLAGIICESRFGWPMVYYVHAVACLCLFLLWLLFYNDHPARNHFVVDQELEKIHRGKSRAHINMDRHVPYRAILGTGLIWVVWLNAFADLFSGMFLLMYIPTYLKSVLHFGVEQTGFLGALPSLAHMPLKFLFGYCSDKLKCVSERTKLLLFNSIAVGLPGFAYLLIGFVPDDHPLLAVFILTAILMFFSTAGGGFYKCGTLCSRQYSHFVVANIQFVKCLTLFVGPALMWLFVQDEGAKEQWRTIFMLLAGCLFAANLLFCLVATDQPAKFTQTSADAKVEEAALADGKERLTAEERKREQQKQAEEEEEVMDVEPF